MKRAVTIVLIAIGLVGLLLPWWRNHAILQDFYDYGLVMAAAGRIELGERPYVDFTTPIQTLQFLAAVFAERVWGARYLSLTYLNAAFIGASFLGLTAILVRRLGLVVAALVAASIVMATSVQHTIIWYNAMGVVWLALVLWLCPRMDQSRRPLPVELLVVCAALWICGLTKLTYLVAALAFAVTFTVRSAVLNTLPWPIARLRLLGFLVFGVIAPVATELMFTGASLEQWLENVVVLPARFRTDMLGQIATVGFYLHTPHDYYKPIHFTYAGAWGVILLAVIAALVARQIWTTSSERAPRLAFLAMLAGGAWICGAVLLATNMDIAYLSGAAWLVFAVGLAEMVPSGTVTRMSVWIRGTLALAALSLLIPATFAAWRGTRALWGHASLVREELVSTNDLPSRFAYIKGMKVFPTFHDSVTAFAAMKDSLVEQGIPLSAFLFVNATEWMVRAIPEARHGGLPLWLAGGTTYSETDAWSIGERFEQDPRIRVVVSYAGWTYWYQGLQQSLNRSYRETRVGPRVHVYVREKALEPIEAAINTQSNVNTGEMTIRGGPLTLQVAKNGLFFLGSEHSHRIDLGSPLFRFSGEMVGELQLRDNEQTGEARFQVYAREGSMLTDVLWEEKVSITKEEPWFSRKFSVSTGGRPVTLVLQLSRGSSGNAGWRRLQIDHSGALAANAPGPLDSTLRIRPLGAVATAGLFNSSNYQPAEVKAFGGEIRADVSDGRTQWITRGASELWFKVDRPAARVAGEYQLLQAATGRGGVRITAICYKSGRLDVLHRSVLRMEASAPADLAVQHFEVGIPEGVAWVGLVATPVDRAQSDAGEVAWRNVKIW